MLVSANDNAASTLAELAATYYGLWNNGSAALFLATDIMRVADGLIVENWNVEDHETLHRQLATPA